jgi:hypothetical protein
MTMKGMMIAATVAGLFSAAAPVARAADSGDVMCEGINACKGKSACAGSNNACSGQNGCKGKGVTKVKTKDDCTKKGGKVLEAKK